MRTARSGRHRPHEARGVACPGRVQPARGRLGIVRGRRGAVHAGDVRLAVRRRPPRGLPALRGRDGPHARRPGQRLLRAPAARARVRLAPQLRGGAGAGGRGRGRGREGRAPRPPARHDARGPCGRGPRGRGAAPRAGGTGQPGGPGHAAAPHHGRHRPRTHGRAAAADGRPSPLPVPRPAHAPDRLRVPVLRPRRARLCGPPVRRRAHGPAWQARHGGPHGERARHAHRGEPGQPGLLRRDVRSRRRPRVCGPQARGGGERPLRERGRARYHRAGGVVAHELRGRGPHARHPDAAPHPAGAALREQRPLQRDGAAHGAVLQGVRRDERHGRRGVLPVP